MSTLKTNKIENLTTADGGISINNSGNVGINVSGPDCLFHVKETGGDSVPARVTSSGTLSTIGFETSASANSYNVRCGATGANDFVAYTNNTERLRVDSNGYVDFQTGILGDNPSDNFTLNGRTQPHYGFNLVPETGVPIGISGYRGIAFATNGAEAMRIDSSKRVGIANSSPGDFDAGADNLVVGSGSGDNGITIYSGASNLANFYFADGTAGSEVYAGGINYSHSTNQMSFFTNGGQTRMSIDNSGNITLQAGTPDWVIRPGGISNVYGRVDIGTDSNSISGTALYVVNTDNNSYAAAANFKNKGTGPSFICMTSAGSDAFRVENNGDVKSATNSYGAVSDVKLKENIVDASSQWDDVKAIRVRKFNFKEETLYDTSTQIGVVAQEIETVSPGLVTSTVDSDEEGKDLGTVTKSVKYSVLYMKSVKALQEAMARIETLEAEVAALKSN